MTVWSMKERLKGQGEETVPGEDVVGGQERVYCSEGHGSRQANPGSSLASLNLGQPHFPHL